MSLRAGELREIIKVQRPERVSNGSGGYETTYTDVIAKTYASVKEIVPSADVIASQQNLKTLVSIKMRYRPTSLKIGDRIVWRDFNFTLASSMKVDALRTTIEITAVSEMEETNRTNEATT